MKNFWDDSLAKFKALPKKQRQYWMIGGAVIVAFAMFGSGGEQAGDYTHQPGNPTASGNPMVPPGGPVEQPSQAQGPYQQPYQPPSTSGAETQEQFERRMAEDGYRQAEVSDAITGGTKTVCYNPTTETMITLPSSYSCPDGTIAQ